ncbi:unnamed protein product, partial [Rotaria sp. Silwood2]
MMFATIVLGSGKSTSVNYIKTAMCQLIDLFPDLYNKKINVNDKVITMTSDVTTGSNDNNTLNDTQFDTINKKKPIQLILIRKKQMKNIGDLFAITDELDSQLVRLGVFKSNDDSAAPGSKLLTQAFDGIYNESRGTGTAKYVIDNAKLTIFGASTGQRYAFNMRNFSQNIGNDGVFVRMSYLVMPHGGSKSLCNRLPISIPNALHISTVISLLVNCDYVVQFRFEKLQSDLDTEPQEQLPQYQRERRSFIDDNMLPMSYELVSTENTRTKRRTIDIEDDGSTLSASGVLQKLINQDMAKSEDLNRAQHVRALYTKTGQKLPRLVANTHLFFIAIHLLTSNKYDLFNYVSFREGSGTANSINGLSMKFMKKAKTVVHNYMKDYFKSETIKVGDTEVVQGKFIIDVTKEAVRAGYNMFKYMQDIQLAIFDSSGLDAIIRTRLTNSSRKIEEARKQLILSTIKSEDSDTALIFKLPSPVLKRVWIANKKDAPSWAGIFCQSSKKSTNSKTTERGAKAVDTLIDCGLIKQDNYLPKNSGLLKVSLTEILHSESLKIALHEYVGISVQEYEQLYEELAYPSDLTVMTDSLINYLISNPNVYAKYYHNYAPEKYSELRICIEKLERDGLIEKPQLNGKVRWKFINYRNPVDHEQHDNLNSYVMNQIQTCQLEEVCSIEHGLKRKLTTLVKRNEVIISPSSSFTITPSKRTHIDTELISNVEVGIAHFQNMLSSNNNNNIIPSCNQTSNNESKNSNNVEIDMHPTITTSRNSVDANTTDCITFTSTRSTITTSNTTSNIGTLPLTHTTNCIAVSAPDLVTTTKITNHDVIACSPMNIENTESPLIPLLTTDENLIDLVEITSSPVHPSDLREPTEHKQADVPTVTSAFDNFPICAKSASSFDDIEEPMDFNNAATNSLTLSPILSVPLLTPTYRHNETATLCNDLINVDKNIPVIQTSSEQHSTMVPSKLSTYSSTPIKTSSIQTNSNQSSALDLLKSFGDISKHTEMLDSYTESSIEITNHPTDTIQENVPNDIPPGGWKDKKQWTPGKDGIDKWSTQ